MWTCERVCRPGFFVLCFAKDLEITQLGSCRGPWVLGGFWGWVSRCLKPAAGTGIQSPSWGLLQAGVGRRAAALEAGTLWNLGWSHVAPSLRYNHPLEAGLSLQRPHDPPQGVTTAHPRGGEGRVRTQRPGGHAGHWRDSSPGGQGGPAGLSLVCAEAVLGHPGGIEPAAPSPARWPCSQPPACVRPPLAHDSSDRPSTPLPSLIRPVLPPAPP